MKRIVLLLAVFLFASAVSLRAQGWEDVQAQKDRYLIGEGFGSTLEEARQNALTELISKISLEVSHEFTQLEEESFQDGNIDSQTKVNSTLTTYSSAVLNNARTITFDPTPDGLFHTARFIEKSEIDRVFKSRISLIKQYVSEAQKYEKEGKVDDALKNYYWSLALLRTLPYMNEVTAWDKENDVERILISWLPSKIDNILNDVKFVVTGRDENYLWLSVDFRGRAPISMQYSYYDGQDYTEPIALNDGKGYMILRSAEIPKILQLKVEYMFLSDANTMNPEVASVLKMFKHKNLKKSLKSIQYTNGAPENNVNKTVSGDNKGNTGSQASTVSVQSKNNEEVADAEYYESIDKVIEAVRSGKYANVKSNFTEEGYAWFTKLMAYGKPHVYGDPEYQLYHFEDRVIARSVPMAFTFTKGARKGIVEDVTFTFDEDGLIESVAFALDKTATDDIMSQGSWPDEAKFTLLEFMENYKTAYCLKRLDYLEQVFSDDALIIVGHVVKKLNRELQGDQVKFGTNEVVTRTEYSKQQYMKHLAECFKRNECINIHFSNNEVMKAGKGGELYGINIKQDYYSTTYGDTGYLFLAVDLNDPDEPIILVRTWQPTSDVLDKDRITLFDFD